MIKRLQIDSLITVLRKIKSTDDFTISTKYKILKLEEELLKENDLNYQLLKEMAEKYGEILPDGSIKIYEENQQQVEKELNEFSEQVVSLPDLKFQVDELENAHLTWAELEVLMPFVKI